MKISSLLLQRGAMVNTLDIFNDWTPLHFSAKKGYQTIVELLLENDAVTNALDKWNRTPLHWAARYGHSHAVELISRNQYVNISKVYEDVYEEINEEGTVEALPPKFKDSAIDKLDMWKKSPLYYAIKFNHPQTVQILLECGASLEL